jgi:dipeptide/tripeptide permease
MQVLGIAFFVIAANMTGVFTRWWGTEQTIFIGSVVSALGCIAIWIMTALGQQTIHLLWFFFVFVNLGLGIRGPAGFYQALLAAGDNDSRGSALVILLVMLLAAGGTGVVAAFIENGLQPVATVAMGLSIASVLLLSLLGRERAP